MSYQLIGNNCVSSFCYKMLNIHQQNMFKFSWCEILKIIEHYEHLNKTNYTIKNSSVDYPIINLDNICDLHFYHYKNDNNFKLQYEYLTNLFNKSIPPLFIIDNMNTNEISDVWLTNTLKINKQYKYLLITKNKQLGESLKHIIESLDIIYAPDSLNSNDWPGSYLPFIRSTIIPYLQLFNIV